MNCERAIDAETWAFIRRTEASYPADAATRPIDEQRRLYDAMCATFRRPRPAGVTTQELQAAGVPCRIHAAGTPGHTVVYFHGGGFTLGGLDSHDDICAEICAQTGYRVVAVDYRLAPEHPYPAAFEDALTAARWAAAFWKDGLVLAGDSAGGNLAAAVAHRARGSELGDAILGQVLAYPLLGGDRTRGSHVSCAEAPMLTSADVAVCIRSYAGGAEPDHDPAFLPLRDDDFRSLPPTAIFTADCDPLRDDGPAYRDRIVAAGGRACWTNETGLVHGYLRARGSVGRAADSFERIVLAIEALGQGLWPWD